MRLRRGGCSNDRAGVTAMGEGDGSPTGPYQSERGEAKSTTIDPTGHTEYNEDGALYFSVFPLPFTDLPSGAGVKDREKLQGNDTSRIARFCLA